MELVKRISSVTGDKDKKPTCPADGSEFNVVKLPEEEHHIEETSSLKRLQHADNEPELPENFQVGEAIGGGDCFFDAVAQGLNQLKTDMDFTVKSLREVCNRFAQSQLGDDQSWLTDALKTETEAIIIYIPRVEFTANDLKQRSEETGVLALTSPIWGRPEIEGRIICSEYNIKLHVIEKHNVEEGEIFTDQIVDKSGSKSSNNVDYRDSDVVHIINRGNAHFEPILNKARVRNPVQQENQNSHSASHQPESGKKQESKMEASRISLLGQPSDPLGRIEKVPDYDHQPSSSFQVSGRLQVTEDKTTDYNNVIDRLEVFFKYFVKEFEAKLGVYIQILEGETTKAGKFSDAFSEIVGQVGGGATGGLIGLSLCSPVTAVKVAKLGASAGKVVVGKIGSTIGNKKHAKKVNKLFDLLDVFQRDKPSFRRTLVEAGYDVFQSYEMQFMRVTTKEGPEIAMQRLAKDATYRTINYFAKNKDALITQGVLLGASKIESVMGVPICSSKIKKPGFEITYTYKSFSEDWFSANLYKKAGFVIEGKPSRYYEKIDRTSKPDRYGYRRLFTSENWSELEHKYKFSSYANSRQFVDYRYILNTENLKQKSEDILKKINLDDESLAEDRIKEMIKEVKDIFIKEIKLLRDFFKDHKILANFEAYLSNLKVDEYLEKYKQNFEAAKQERQEIAKSIEVSQAENRENFNKLSQKQDIHDDGNKKEHKKTQEGIERVEEVIKYKLVAQNSERKNEPVLFDISYPVDTFLGRIDALSDLHSKIQCSSEKSTVKSQMTLISGLGGIGKTELARKYASDHKNDYDGNVIWINAENHSTLAASFRRLNQDELGISNKDSDGEQKDIKSIVKDVYTYFSKGKSLFIFDNAQRCRTQENGDEGIDKYLPSLPSNANTSYILITSRNQNWGDVEVLQLGTFTKEEAVDFIRQGLGIKDGLQENEIKKLVETLQSLPLALQQAIAYIKERDKTLKITSHGFNISDYLKRFEYEASKLLDFEFPEFSLDLYTKTTFTTWKITTDYIRKNKEHGKQAGRILDIIAYLAPDSIPVGIFLELELIGGDKEKLGDAVQLLYNHSMINLRNQELSIHRLVQEVTRINLQDQNKDKKILGEAFKLLEKSFPYHSAKLEDRARKKNLMPHLEVFLLHMDEWLVKQTNDTQKKEIEKACIFKLLIWMADGYEDLGEPRKQKEMLELVLKMKEIHYGGGCDNYAVAMTLVKLGYAYGDLGNYTKKKESLERALIGLEKHYGPDNFNVVIALLNLGNAYGDLGDNAKKKELLERALTIQVNHFGSDHFEVARTLADLGNTYGDLGEHTKRKQLLEEALAIEEEHYGPDHFKVAKTLVDLGNAYGDLGEHTKRKQLLEEALAIEEEHYGPDHFKVAKTLVDLGNAYGDLGDDKKKKELLERALIVIKDKHFDRDHFEAATILANLGNAFGDLGDNMKRRGLLERAVLIIILNNHFGRDNFKVARILVHLGLAYGELGYSTKKKEMLERAVIILDNHFGRDHFEVARILVHLGLAYGELGNSTKKKEVLERAVLILDNHFGRDHFEVARILVHLGLAYGELGNSTKKKEVLERAVIILDNHFGRDHFELTGILVHLGLAYGELGNSTKKKEVLERALIIEDKHFGRDDFSLAAILVHLAQANGELDDHKKKKELLERAFTILYKHFGRDHFEVATILADQGNTYGDLGDHTKRKQLLEEALAIEEKHYSPDHFKVAKTLVDLGNAYRDLGDDKKKKELLKRALIIVR